jgi:hypothetical protein
MATIEWNGGWGFAWLPPTVPLPDPPRCPKCGAPEGEPHVECSSPYRIYSTSKTRTLSTPDATLPINRR